MQCVVNWKSDFHIDTLLGNTFPYVRYVVRVMDERQFPPEKALYTCQTTYPHALCQHSELERRASAGMAVLQYDPS